MRDESDKGPRGWKVASRVDGKTIEHEGEGILDELWLDDWLRIEALEPNVYWLRVGDARLTAEVTPEGRVIVDIQRGFYAEVEGSTTVHSYAAPKPDLQAASAFQVEVLGLQEWDERDDNIDVVVTLADGSRYTATFFTVENLRRLMFDYRETGECAAGTYIWAVQMVILRDLRRDTMRASVASLIESKEFWTAFLRIP